MSAKIRLTHRHPLLRGSGISTQFGHFPIDAHGVLEAPEHIAHEMVNIYGNDMAYADPADDPSNQEEELVEEEEAMPAMDAMAEPEDVAVDLGALQSSITRDTQPPVNPPIPKPEPAKKAFFGGKKGGRKAKAKN